MGMAPDLVFQRDGKPVFVADVKYKLTGSGLARTDDYYQLLAYTTAMGLGAGLLIYCRADEAPERVITVVRGGQRLHTRPVDLSGTPGDIDVALGRAGRHRSPPVWRRLRGVLMGELLPSIAARAVQSGLLDYLQTTFALSDEDVRLALEEFLQDPDDGIFKGPYLRLRMPFRPAADGWRDTLGWHPIDEAKPGAPGSFTPYGHQAEAFARLSSADLGPDKPRPLPTLVTTGTGSGKTEAFLYPILDHVLRAKAPGVTGTKALLLYPMNALANDQAQRLADLITTRRPSTG